MKKIAYLACTGLLLALVSCSTAYQATPLPFKAPSSYANHVEVDGAVVGAKAFENKEEATKVFGFDILSAGLLPVQVAFDNESGHSMRIVPSQTFLEDDQGNLWPILANNIAYDRATKYAETNEVFKAGAKDGLLGAVGGALIGAAVGIVTGEGVGAAAGKGAAVGAAAGATIGGASKLGDQEAKDQIISDLRGKSLENKAIPGNGLAFGIIFFPAEAKSAQTLRLTINDTTTGQDYAVKIGL
ncbi:MAG: hypothetical protein AB1921_11190 [Thermodesulfobacteriota bacterium]